MKKRILEWLINRLERRVYRLEDRIERLRWKLPYVPCDDPMVEREVQRLSRSMFEYQVTHKAPYLDIIDKQGLPNVSEVKRSVDDEGPFYP